MSLLRHSLVLSILLASPAAAQNLDSLLARMTLEEKLGQLNLLSAGGRASPAQMQLVREGKLGGLFNVIGAENTTPVQRIAVTESRLKIPLLFGLDVIHGYRAIFPIPLGEAGTFDPDAAEATARGRPGSRRLRDQLDVRADGGYRARPPLGPHRRGLGGRPVSGLADGCRSGARLSAEHLRDGQALRRVRCGGGRP